MLGENQNLTSSGGEILQKSVFKKLLISLEQTIFNFFSENLEASVQQTMKLYDLENQFSFYFVIGNLIYYGFISKNNSFDTYIKYLKAIQTKEDEMIKNKSKIFEAFSQCMLQIGTLESYYLIEKMIDLNLINENIIKNIDSLYFAHRKQIKKDSFLWKCILNRYSYFEETSKNNWELHKKLIEEGHNPNEIAKIIRNDEIEKLQEISSQNDFNFNQAIRPSVYERSSFVNNWVPLIEYAAFFGSVKCFKYLLMNGSNINNTGKYAVAGGNEEIIHLCEQNHSSFEGAYEAAIKFHRNAIFYYIYEKKLELFDKNAKQNSQSLGNIIQSNDNQLMFPLNIHGVKYRENNQNHPFFTLNDNQQKICQTINDLGCYCIMYGNYEILSFLEDEGIEGSDFLINKSASVGNLYLVKYFIKDNQFPKDILIFSSKSGNVELVKYIIEQKVIDINNKDSQGWTALMSASNFNNIEIVKLLLEQEGIDINAKNNDGNTALICASINGNADIVKLLLEQEGIDINAKDNGGKNFILFKTALMWASENDHTEVVKLHLEQKGIDINAKDNQEQTAIIKAIKHGHLEIVKLLLSQKDIDINVKDNRGRTAFMLASQCGKTEVAQLLIERKGINTNTKQVIDRRANHFNKNKILIIL